MIRPQYRLLVDDYRVFYDVTDLNVEVLAVVPKPQARQWLERYGKRPAENEESD